MNIAHIAQLHYLRTMKNRFLSVIILLGVLANILGVALRIGLQDFFPLPSSESLTNTFHLWSFGAIGYCIFHGAGLFTFQIQQRYFTSTMTKPISFWEYQLGHFLSLYLVFISISMLSIFLMVSKSIVYGTSFPRHFTLTLCNLWIDAGVSLMIVMSMGFVWKKPTALAIFFGTGILASISPFTEESTHPVIQGLSHLVYAITPLERTIHIKDLSEFTTMHWFYMTLENTARVLYAGMFLILSNLYYKKRDYPLRES